MNDNQNPEDAWVATKSPSVVRQMFTDISSNYDALNHILSLNIDKRWRRILAKETLAARPQNILDVCGGTGDLSLTLESEARKRGLKSRILCSDFTPAMTRIAKSKFNNRSKDSDSQTLTIPMIADTLRLPFADDAFDLVTVAFGIRNVVDPAAGLREMTRVCRPGGQVVVLEFSKTRNPVIDGAFSFYFTRILPQIGKLVTGTRAYNYLSKSVAKFPEGKEFQDMLSSQTGSATSARKLSFGIATLYISQKA